MPTPAPTVCHIPIIWTLGLVSALASLTAVSAELFALPRVGVPHQTPARPQERDMPAIPSDPPDIQSVTVVAVIVASLCVIYWRIALRLVAVALIALAIYGAILITYGLRHLPGGKACRLLWRTRNVNRQACAQYSGCTDRRRGNRH